MTLYLRAAAMHEAKELLQLVKEYLRLLNVVETTDSGREFRPNQLGSCRAIDGARMNAILARLQDMVNDKHSRLRDFEIS